MLTKSEKLPLPEDSGCSKISHRVTYAEVDRMGYVYYGNYAVWFEMGRTELIRETGTPYSKIEDKGYYLPVRKCDIRYYKPTLYDDQVKIITVVTRIKKASINFLTVIYDINDNLISEGHVELACTDNKGKPAAVPDELRKKLKERLWE